MKNYIYQHTSWPQFTWNNEEILSLLGNVRNLQGKLLGKMEMFGFELQNEASLETITLDVIKSSEIEGEILNQEEVRSSIARRLGIEIPHLTQSGRDVDGVVDLMLDATQNFKDRLTTDRLFGWHSSLFPSGRSGLYKIIVGNWRNDALGPMQVVSGGIGKEHVHYQAPDAIALPYEMKKFIDWFNNDLSLDPVIKAAIAHLWFITIHPFEDGNGRIARAITDMQLARADGSKQRFYSMSSQITKQRKEYYTILEITQKGSTDITVWLKWFLECLLSALEASEETLAKILFKHNFWSLNTARISNERQKVMLNKLLDNFEGKLTSVKWAKITKCSTDTALRDIQDLINKGILQKAEEGGRSTSYRLVTD